MQLEELRAVRSALGHWKDEPPLRSLVFPTVARAAARRKPWLAVPLAALRYAALAATVLLAFLALANANITWNEQGFAFQTHLMGGSPPTADYYTRSEMRELLKKALDDTEGRVMESNYLLIQEMLDTVEEERFRDLRLVRSHVGRRTQ
jgi:hypothetical protein